jgi:hypothetical protein
MSAADSHHAIFVLTTAALVDDFRASIPKCTFNHGEVTSDRTRVGQLIERFPRQNA